MIECAILVPSGRLYVSTVPEDDLDPPICVPAGAYEVVVCWGEIQAMHARLAKAKQPYELGFAKPQPGEVRDHYRIILTPGSPRPMRMLKAFAGNMSW